MEHAFGIDPTSLSREHPITFPALEGQLEGLWRPPAPGKSPRGVVVVAHPHPAYQGTMMNKVVFHLARVFNHDFEFASLRFNFRGVGGSSGTYDEGRGEVEDVRAAWMEARRRIPRGALLAAGFSFGSAMTLYATVQAPPDQRPTALALVGIPLRLFDLPTPHYPLPLAAVHGELDQFTSPEKVFDYLSLWPAPTHVHIEPDADHFLDGHLPTAMGFLSRSLRPTLA